MFIIIPAKMLRAHLAIKATNHTNLALNGIYINRDGLTSCSGPIIMTSNLGLNQHMRSEYLVNIDRVPAKASMAVIDTNQQICYFLDHIVSHSQLNSGEKKLNDIFIGVTGARAMIYPFPDVKPQIKQYKQSKVADVRMNAHVMSKLSQVSKIISNKSGLVTLGFSEGKGGMIKANIKQGATDLNLYFKAMI